jgi:uncharacterized membrane protein YgcG
MDSHNRLTEALDDTLASRAHGESFEACAVRYPDLTSELMELVEARAQLDLLSQAPRLSADSVAARRRQFLTATRAFKLQPAPETWLQRLTGWLFLSGQRAQPAWIPALARVVIALAVIASVLSGTAAAAQASLPDSSLYGVKLMLEDARLQLTNDPAQQAMLALAFAAERAREMERMAAFHQAIGADVSLRLQNQLDAALRYAARASDSDLLRLLERARAMTQDHERALAQARLQAQANSQAALLSAEQAMAQARQQAEAGLADPNTFRSRYRRGQSAPAQPTAAPQATTTQQQPTLQPTVPATTTQPPATLQASVTPQRTPAGPGQLPTSAPGPKVTVSPRQTGPGSQPTPGQGGGPGSGGGAGGGSGSEGGVGGSGDGRTRHP